MGGSGGVEPGRHLGGKLARVWARVGDGQEDSVKQDAPGFWPSEGPGPQQEMLQE